MMRIVPGYEAEAGVEQGLCLFRIAVSILRVLRKYGNDPEGAARGQAYHGQLPAEASRKEAVQFIVGAGGNIDPFGGVPGDAGSGLAGDLLLASQEQNGRYRGDPGDERADGRLFTHR